MPRDPYVKLNEPTTFRTGAHWLAYLLSALRREQGAGELISRDRRGEAGRRLFNVAKDADHYTLACALDLLACLWEELDPHEVLRELNTAALLRPIWEYPYRPVEFWKHVWLSRFARDAREAAYYTDYLEVYEAAIDAGPVGRPAKEQALRRLRRAEVEVLKRGGPPAFQVNVVRAIFLVGYDVNQR